MTVNVSPFGPKPQMLLASGAPAVGYQLFFYVAGSVNTKQNTYTDSTGLSANTNPIVLNSLGEPSNEIWFSSGVLYKVVYAPVGDTDPPSSPIWTIDNLPGQSEANVTLSQWVASTSVPTYINATTFSVAGDQTSDFQVGRRLKFTVGAGTVYGVIRSSVYGVLTTVQVWMEYGASLDAGLSQVDLSLLESTRPALPATTLYVSGPDYGTVGNGIFDCTTAIQGALNAQSFGGSVVLGPGTFKYSSLTVPDGVTVKGQGPYATSLLTNAATGTCIALGEDAGLESMKIGASVTRTAGFYVDIQDNSSWIDGVDFDGYYIAVNIGTNGGAQPVDPTIIHCNFRNPAVAAGCGGVQAINYSNLEFSDNVMTGPTPGTQPDFGLRLRNGDTAHLADNNITLHGKALLLDPQSGENNYATNIVGGFYDSAGTISGATTVSCAELIPANGAGVFDFKATGTWFGLSASKSGFYAVPPGTGSIDGVALTGCEFVDNGDNGAIFGGATVLNWNVSGGFSGGNTNVGIRAATATARFSICGHSAGNISGRGANNYGIVVDNAASNNYSIVGNNVTGNTTAGLLDEGTGITKLVLGNLGFSGIISPAQLTANTDNWAPTGLNSANVIRVSTDAARNLTGIQALNAGRQLTIQNVGVQNLVVKHDATSTAANRFLTPGGTDFTLISGLGAIIWYDDVASRWRIF